MTTIIAVCITTILPTGSIPDRTATKIRAAFGAYAAESNAVIKLWSPKKGLLVATNALMFVDGHSIKITPCRLAWFEKKDPKSGVTKILVAEGSYALLRLDEPVTSLVGLANREIIAVELPEQAELHFGIGMEREILPGVEMRLCDYDLW